MWNNLPRFREIEDRSIKTDINMLFISVTELDVITQ